MAIERWRPRWGITPWRPFRELEEWERRFDDLFGRPLWRLPVEEKGWMPALDVFEKEDKFVVKAELPGMKEDDIDVSVVGDTLSIKGEKKTETEVKEEDYYRCERSHGTFYRSIPLPSNVDADKIEGSFEDGVLEVTLPKSAKVKPKKIAVSAKKKATQSAKKAVKSAKKAAKAAK
ncbi:MAG: Hsp20/alpha crystallin family protein [Chloroflexota bacterium]